MLSALVMQIDWRAFQANHRAEWLECLRAAFAGLDSDRDGRVHVEELMRLLQDKLPEDAVSVSAVPRRYALSYSMEYMR